MRPNKTLDLAVASALVISTNLSFAGKLDIGYVDANCVKQSRPATLASELFLADNPVVPITTSTCPPTQDDLNNQGWEGPAADGTYNDKWWYAKYTFATDRVEPFTAQFSFDNGAQFGKNVSLALSTELDFIAHPSGSHASSVTINSGGGLGDSQVTLSIDPQKMVSFRKDQDTLFLRFKMQNLDILKSPGKEIKMTANVSDDGTTDPVTVLTSKSTQSTQVVINPTSGIAQIDTAKECTTFTGNGTAFIDSTRVKLGSILIQDPSNILNADLSEWKFNPDTISILSTANPGTLTITDGTFSASVASPGKVFLDLNKDGIFTSGTDIPTTTVIGNNVAQWDLTSNDLTNLYNSNGADIIVKTDGQTLIQGQPVPANAIFEMNYSSNQDIFSQQLLQIGSCTPSTPSNPSNPSTPSTPSNPPPATQPLPSTTNLTINFNGTGHGHVTTDPSGIDCDSSQLKCSHSFDTATWVKFIPTPAADSKFTDFSGYQSDCANGKVFLSGFHSCSAYFTLLPHQLTVNVTGQGSVSTNPAGLTCDNQCSHEFKGGEKVTLTATPKANWQFEKWQGDCDQNGQVSLDKDQQCEAVFVKIPHQLTVNVTGQGSVSSNPDGLTCDNQCSHEFKGGEKVTLTATPKANWQFEKWQGDCDQNGQVSLDKDQQCEAVFVKIPHQLTVNVTGRGSVNSNPGGLACDSQCSHKFRGGEQVTLIATSKANWQFEKWQGDCDQNGQVSLDKDQQCEAVFARVPCSIDPQQQWSYFYPPSPNFGTILVGDSIALNQTVWFETDQQCGGPLYIDKIEVIGQDAAEFKIENMQCYHYSSSWWYQSYSHCYFNTVFQPTTAGDKQAQLTLKLLNYEELTMPTVALQAKAVDTGQAQLDLTPTEHDFGTVFIGRGSPQPQSFTLKNTGEISLNVDNIILAGDNTADFSLEIWSCNYIGILHPNAQCYINAWFRPTTVGQKQARVTVAAGNLNAESLLTGIAEEAKDCSDANITIESIQNGSWDAPTTWSTATTPTTTDVVRINSGHTITGQELAKIRTLCVQAGATLESLNDQGTALEIQATDYLENHGLIRGKDGKAETQSTCTRANLGTEGCAQPGANVILKVGTIPINQYYYGSGGPILNAGEIIAGKGGDGSQYGAPGGIVNILGNNVTNTNLIQAGNGGNILGTNIGQGGYGGYANIWSHIGGNGHLYNQNSAKILAGNGGNCNNSQNQQTGGYGGNILLVSSPYIHLEGGITKAGIGGQNCTTNGQNGYITIDPNVISLAGAATQVSGGNIAIYGGNDWTLDLSNLTGTIVTATGTLTLAVGKGGLIDFRNSTGQILTAKEVQIFTDNLLIDSGKKISDYIAAENIIIGPSKILRNVSLTVASKLFGNPGEVLSIPLVIANNGPEDDQYTLTVKDSAGNILNQLAAVEVKGLNIVNLAIDITIPASNKVIFTAVSQADQEVSSTSEVILTTIPVTSNDGNQVTSPGNQVTSNGNQVTSSGNQVASNGNQVTSTCNKDDIGVPTQVTSECNQVTSSGNQVAPDGNQVTSSGNQPTHESNDVVIIEQPTLNICHVTSDGIIDWTCINKEQILTDVTLESNAKISGGQLAGTIDNQGFVSQVTIQPDTILKGGKLSGYIVNQGTLMDFEFVGAQVTGGTLAGQIINNSLIGGVFKDVHLAADAHLSGGYLQGEIQGEPAAPALLEDVAIQAGSHLAQVKIGKNVTWSADVVFEDNVQFVEPTTYCNLTPLAEIMPLLHSLDVIVIGKAAKPCSQLVGGVSTDGKVFQRQLTVTRADSVEVLGRIAPDLRQVNQVVELVLSAAYRAVETEPPLYFMVDAQGQVLPWDGEVSHLVAFKESVRLESVQSLRWYRGRFPATGQLEIQFGYRLADGTVVLNAQPLEVVVSE